MFEVLKEWALVLETGVFIIEYLNDDSLGEFNMDDNGGNDTFSGDGTLWWWVDMISLGGREGSESLLWANKSQNEQALKWRR